MHTIRMPKAARTTTEGTVGRWHITPGQAVRKGDVLVDIETPEALVELESAADGVLLKVLAAEGTVLPVGSPLALVGAKGEDVSEAMEALANEGKPAAAPTKPSAKPSEPAPAASPTSKVIPVLMPQAGQSMEEGTILEWKVQPGDAVQTGQILFEVETDKATIEIEAADAGRLARIVEQRDRQRIEMTVHYGIGRQQ
ncbi:MAG TPA: hypothetical protein DCX07_04345, partial [Phycisphaerales bacterium]|nr:hypothetical protein [Phycisphaerales bacterium]